MMITPAILPVEGGSSGEREEEAGVQRKKILVTIKIQNYAWSVEKTLNMRCTG